MTRVFWPILGAASIFLGIRMYGWNTDYHHIKERSIGLEHRRVDAGVAGPGKLMFMAEYNYSVSSERLLYEMGEAEKEWARSSDGGLKPLELCSDDGDGGTECVTHEISQYWPPQSAICRSSGGCAFRLPPGAGCLWIEWSEYGRWLDGGLR